MSKKSTLVIEQRDKKTENLIRNKKTETEVAIRESLARLLATENISVQHKNLPTAGFDVKNRALYLPNWVCSKELYTTLITHEVGHALYTPNALPPEALKDKLFAGVLNVLEDVRIEKKMLKKFPGFRKDFHRGYNEMMERDFFGLEKNNTDLEDLNLFDRINIHYKAGRYTNFKVPFSTVEQNWVDRVDECDTFDDVMILAKELYEFEKEQQEQKQQQNQQGNGPKSKQASQSPAGNQGPQSDSDADQQGDSQSGQGQQEKDDQQSNSDQGQGNSKQGDGEQSSLGSGQLDDFNNNDTGDSLNVSTQDSLEKALGNMVETDGHYDPSEVILPKNMNLEPYILRYDKILKSHERFYSKDSMEDQFKAAEISFREFQRRNRKVINNLVNLFNMKKSAKLSKKTKVSKLGSLNMSKIHKYKYAEDVFNRRKDIPKGKNHGLIMFLDMSGSMHHNLPGAIEQILVLTLFCKKVNIPFDVYGFTDVACPTYSRQRNADDTLSKKVNEIDFTYNFHLRNYFSSKMNSRQFDRACINMTAILNFYKYESIRRYGSEKIPEHLKGIRLSVSKGDNLGCTPLDPAIISAIQLVKDMKLQQKVDIVNTVFISDGENTHRMHTLQDHYNNGNLMPSSISNNKHVFIKDAKSGKSWKITDDGQSYSFDATKHLLSILKQLTGSRNIGFFIESKKSIEYTLSQRTKQSKEQIEKMLDTKGFVEVLEHGYDAYYYIPDGTDLQINDSEKNLYDAQKRKRERILLSRFIDIIA